MRLMNQVQLIWYLLEYNTFIQEIRVKDFSTVPEAILSSNKCQTLIQRVKEEVQNLKNEKEIALQRIHVESLKNKYEHALKPSKRDISKAKASMDQTTLDLLHKTKCRCITQVRVKEIAHNILAS